MSPLKYLLTICCFAAFGAQAQTEAFRPISREQAGEMLQLASKWYTSTPTFSLAVTHSIYAGHTSTQPYEQSVGYYRKYAGGYHSRILTIHTIQNKNVRITLDTSEKVMLVANAQPAAGGVSAEEYLEALKKCTALRAAATAKGSVLQMEFGKHSRVTLYEIEFDKSGRFASVKVLYANEVQSEEGTPVKPKLVITFDKYSTAPAEGRSELNEGRYYTKQGNELIAMPAFAGYNLLDQRIPDQKP
jgi:hypothetical protein